MTEEKVKHMVYATRKPCSECGVVEPSAFGKDVTECINTLLTIRMTSMTEYVRETARIIYYVVEKCVNNGTYPKRNIFPGSQLKLEICLRQKA